MQLCYKPHLGFSPEFFTVDVKNSEDAVFFGTALSLYQSFLASHSHSQHPKARIEIRNEKNEIIASSQNIVNSINKHPLFDLSDFDAIASYAETRSKLRLEWFPQVPCKPFRFPVKSVEQAAELASILADYDLFLLEKCTSMRVDFCNTCDLSMISTDEDSDSLWVSWYLDDLENDAYYDSFSDYQREHY